MTRIATSWDCLKQLASNKTWTLHFVFKTNNFLQEDHYEITLGDRDHQYHTNLFKGKDFDEFERTFKATAVDVSSCGEALTKIIEGI